MTEPASASFVASDAPCWCLPEDGIYTCTNSCNSFAPMAELHDSAIWRAPELLRTDPAPCTDCGCIPCYCEPSNYITSSRSDGYAGATTNNETAPTPSPAETSPAALTSPVLQPLPDHLIEKMHAFMGAAGIMFAEHKVQNIGDIIYDTWNDVVTSRHKTWNDKLEAFHFAMHCCNYMMHVTDKIMDDLTDYTFDYFKATCCRRHMKDIMSKLIFHWGAHYDEYLACSAESQNE